MAVVFIERIWCVRQRMENRALVYRTIVIHESSMTTGGSVLVHFQAKRAKLDKLERQSQEAAEAADRWAGGQASTLTGGWWVHLEA